MTYNICAIIVSYNGNNEIIKSVKAIESQVSSVIIIDNNSKHDTIKVLEKFSSDKIHIVYNKQNFGIAKALNQGVEFAKKHNYKWILTLDQDSTCDANLIAEFEKDIDLYAADNIDSKIKVFTPRICYTPDQKNVKQIKHQECITSITSGNLINIKVFDIIGLYNEKLFIDSVDFDFCLRLANSGLKIIQNNDAVLYHSLGEIKKIWFFTIHVHSSLRRYYMARNHVYILRKYFKTNTIFCVKKQLWFSILLFQILFLESNKNENLKHIYIGIKDGLKNNFTNNNKLR